jgi:hypothetical protein
MKNSSAAAKNLHVVSSGQTPRPVLITTPAGAKATVEGETISVFRADGTLVASFDSATGALRIEAPGDLCFAAPNGKVLVESRDGIALRTGAGEASSFDVKPDGVHMRASLVDIAAGALEVRAERIIEKATDVYRDIDGLLETRAHRLRSIVSTTLELFGRRTTIASEKDTRIDGKRVLLG